MKRGRFITLEGGEGTGKSTQVRRLAAALEKHGHKTLVTREPGGAASAEKIRDILLRSAGQFTPLAQALLHNAARAEHLQTIIRPALERGEWVVCDRFMDSTRAYQGALGVDANTLDTLERLVVGQTFPDLTFILDMPAHAGLDRALKRAFDKNEQATSYEEMAIDLHLKLREAFLRIAQAEPTRCAVIDATGDIDTVAKAIWETLSLRLEV